MLTTEFYLIVDICCVFRR